MSRTRRIAAWAVFLATFAWLLGPGVQGGPASLWPSAVALGLAFITRNIYLSLFLGALSGAILLREGNAVAAFLDLFARHLLPALQDSWNVSVLVFTLMMGGFVEVLNRGGGMSRLAQWVLGPNPSRRRAGLGVYLMGFVVFIDGLANSMLVGKTMRPIADRAGLSREKLAFIVDSTSSPIAGLALVSTWVAYEMSMIREGLAGSLQAAAFEAGLPFQLLVESLPYRFYNYYILLIVFLVVWSRRDLGAMRHAEGRSEPVSIPHDARGPGRGRVWVALVPLLVLVAGVFVGLYLQGGGLQEPFGLQGLISAYGRANAALVFVWSTAFASLLAIALAALFPGSTEPAGATRAFFEGMNQMFLPALILVFAWTLNGVIKEAGTAAYLVSFLGDKLAGGWLPLTVFLVSALVSFATGTSWGTMAIVMPLVLPLAAMAGGAEPIMVGTVGAVLAGAVFGDHCSPISDTTIVSAFSSGCDAMDHVRTQLPYALLAAAAAVVLGYGPAGWGINPFLLLAAGGLASWAVLKWGARL